VITLEREEVGDKDRYCNTKRQIKFAQLLKKDLFFYFFTQPATELGHGPFLKSIPVALSGHPLPTINKAGLQGRPGK